MIQGRDVTPEEIYDEENEAAEEKFGKLPRACVDPLVSRFRPRSWRPTHFLLATSDLRISEIKDSFRAAKTVSALLLQVAGTQSF